MQSIKLMALSATILLSIISDSEVIKLNVEPNHSTIGFTVPIAGGITKVRGKFMDFQLYMDYIDQDMTASTVKFVIQATSIDTGIADRDSHLRSADFFEVEKYTEITLESSSIRKAGQGYLLNGSLTMHGITKSVSIPFKVTDLGKSQVAISIDWKLNRKEYGVGTNFKHTSIKNFIADEIGIQIDLWTSKAKVQGD